MRRSETRRGSQIAEKGQRAFRDAECNYRRTTRFCRLVAAAILGILIVSRLYVAVAADVLTQHYNNGRTGATLDESILNTTNVSSGKFEKLWTLYADGQVVAQPLYVSNLSIDTTANRGAPVVKGKFNTVIIATMHNTAYAYDADKENRGPDGRTVPLWATWLGPPRPGTKDIDMWSTNDPEWGILSTPVISEDKTTLFVVAWHNDGADGLRYRLHALDLKSGAPRQPPVAIGASSSDPSQPCKPQNTFNPCTQKQRAALILANGIIYVGFGGDGNRGALFAFDAATLAQRAFWSSTPSGVSGGIWQSGQGPAADAEGNIYLMTGNGTFDADTNGPNFGSSFVKLNLEGQKLVVKDFFTPCNYKFLNQLDLDLGSAGPMLVPDTPPRIISGGKEGILYVLSPMNMGKYAASPTAPDCQNSNAVQQVNAFPPVMHNGQKHWGNIHGSPVFWKEADTAWVYAWGENSRLEAFNFGNGMLQNVENPKESKFRPPLGMPGGMLTVSANGSSPGTGVVWAVVPLDGDANQQRGVKGIVLALDAHDVSRTLWTSEQDAQRDRLGLFAKFTPPLVADAKVFVATYGDDEPRRTYPPGNSPTGFPKNYYVAVYGLQTAPKPVHPIVDQDRDDVAVIRAETAPLMLDVGQCKPIDAASVDCTEALAERAQAPSFHRIVHPANQNFSGCALLRVTTAAKNAALQSATGIGFWSTQAVPGNQGAEDAGRLVPKDQLEVVGTATLKSGEPATLYQFVGLVNCPVSGSEQMARLFKPYMEFAAPDGRIFRNWDLASNYLISGTVAQFDRSADVLRQ
jgi:outer membrane protein assembly factor BamB